MENDCYCRRCRYHDYYAPFMYLLTLRKNPNIANFSIVYNTAKDNEPPCAGLKYTEIGKLLRRAKNAWLAKYPILKILNHVIMPDHMHILLHVTRRSEYHLEEYVYDFMYMASCLYYQQFSDAATITSEDWIFRQKFNDKIVSAQGDKNTFYHYIVQNPYRYLIRKLYPDYFQRVNLLLLGSEEYEIYGNSFLLAHPTKINVRFTSKISESEMKGRKLQWLETIRQGGVLVSPFINPIEKKARNYAIQNGASLIIIRENGFPDRFKPAGDTMIDLCAKGRLLIVAPKKYNSRKEDMLKSKAEILNVLALTIANINYTDFQIKNK